MKSVYILESLDHPNRYYTGIADDVSARLEDHNRGHSLHTKKYAPWKIIVSVAFEDEAKAHQFEQYLKSGSGRAFAKRHF